MTKLRFSSPAAAAAAATLMSLASSSAMAAVVCNSAAPMPYTVAATADGSYINFLTAAFEATATPTPGWDFNPYGATLLTFWFNNSAALGAVTGGGTAYQVLAAGTPIGPTSTFAFANSAALMATWRAGSTGGYLGLRFLNEGTGVTNYGWVQMNSTGPNGHPAIINGYCYQNNGTQIQAGGSVPVSLQSYSVD